MSLEFRKLFFVLLLFSFLSEPLQASEPLRDLSVSLPADRRAFQKIRILVTRSKPEIKVSCVAAYEVYDDQGKLVFHGPKLLGATVKPVANGIQWWKDVIPSKFLLVKSIQGSIRVSQTGRYKDEILISKNSKNTLDIINKLDLEDYVKSVIPFEGNPQWSLEALKAQAVVSRTFALARLLERRDAEYDVSPGVMSQVYVGSHIESGRTSEAVDATHGEVLMYNNKVFPAYYHSTCGGATTAADKVWRVKPHPALAGVECKFCEQSPHYRWEVEVSRSEIKEKLAKNGVPVKEVLGIRTGKVDKTGRAHELIIKSTWAERSVDADAFRGWIDPMHLKSSLITRISEKANGTFVFKGKGWGHGVGLCQFGMKYLGELGYGYRDILNFYYPPAQIVKLPEPAAG